MSNPERIAALFVLIALLTFLCVQTPAHAADQVSLEVVLLDAVEGDAGGNPDMDKLAKNVKSVLEKTKDYKSFATKDYDLDNADLDKAFALQLKKKIKGMKVEITPTSKTDEQFALKIEWKQDDKVLIRQTTKIKQGKWYIAAHPREDGTAYLLMVKPGDAISDLKAERKKRGLPEEKKKDEE